LQLARYPTQDAKTITSEEFLDVVDQIWVDAGYMLYEALHATGPDVDCTPILSFDRHTVHNIDKVENRIKVDRKHSILPLQHHVPDVQKVIEHCHANNNRRLKRAVLEKGTKLHPSVYHSMLRDAFMSTDVLSLQKDISSVQATLKHILLPKAQGGSEGGYALPTHN
jgi:hypothetical protein